MRDFLQCQYCDLCELQRWAWCEGLEVMINKLPFGYKVSIDRHRASYVVGKMPKGCTCKIHVGYVRTLRQAAMMLDIVPIEEGT